MKPANGTLIALMTPGTAAKQWVHADLYTWTLVGGSPQRFTSADRNLTISGNTFLSTNALFKRGPTSSKLGLEIPTLDIEVSPRPGIDLIGGVDWYAAARLGNLDWADVLVERFLSDDWTNVAVSTLYQFSGKVGPVTFNRGRIQIKLVSPLKVLNQKSPPNLYQATCVHTLYDGTNGVSGCSRNGLTRASKTVTGTVSAGSTVSAIKTSRGEADNYFNLGVITFTSGALNGIQRSIDSYTLANGMVNVTYPLPVAPSAADTFSMYPGCNKLFGGDCTTKFANTANFKGTDQIPVPETAV